MDAWNERHLKFMALGGNEKLKKFFEGFDLMEESVQTRYNSVAADFFRKQLRMIVAGEGFFEERPSYEKGREEMPFVEPVVENLIDVNNQGEEQNQRPQNNLPD